jgi:hypothetical protein
LTIFGLDFSHYDGLTTGDRIVSEGFAFMTHKAGGDALDPELGAWWDGVKARRGVQWLLAADGTPFLADAQGRPGFLPGAYWVLYPGSPRTWANSFVHQLDVECPGWRRGPFLLQADCEKWNSDPSTVPPVADINAFCDRLVELLPRLNPVPYAPDWVYGDLGELRYPTWSSKYVTGTGTASGLYPGDSAPQWAAYGGKTPAILQFTSKATALGQTTCDANAYRGTLAELTALVAPGWDIPMADLTPAQIWGADLITNPKQRADSPLHTPPGTNKTTAASFAVGDMWARVEDIYDTVNTLTAALGALSEQIAALEAAVDAITAPATPVITQEVLSLAVVNALKALAGGEQA